MAVEFDALSESHAGTSGDTNHTSYSWTHTPVGTPRGVLVTVHTFADVDLSYSVTYGGVSMSAVSGGAAICTDGDEDCRCYTFFLGASIPTGAQTVVVNRTSNATASYATAFTVTAAGDTEVYSAGIVLQQSVGTLAEQNVDDGRTNAVSLRFGALTSGLDSLPTVGSNSTGTTGTSIDIGVQIARSVRETLAGPGSRPVGLSSVTSDDRAGVYLAVREVTPAGDIMIDAAAFSDMNTDGVHGPFWISPDVGAVVGIDGNSDMVAWKTADKGRTWTKVVAEAGTAKAHAAFYDRQNPGNTGTKVHCAWVDSAAGDFTYAAFDINAGTWSTPVDINASASVSATSDSNQVFIAQTRAGGLIAGHVNSATAAEAFKSADGSSWASINSPFESNANDRVQGVSCNTGDNADAAILFNDTSAVQLSVKVYDDSANTWNETIVGGGANTSSSARCFDGTTRLSDGHVIVASWNAFDATTADIDMYDVNINTPTAGSVSVTTLTDAVVDSAESGYCAVVINQSNNDIYVGYLSGSSLTATVLAKYVKSTNGGSSWGSPVTYSQGIEDDYRTISGGAMGATQGGRIMFAWFDDDDNNLFTNISNDIEIAAAAAGPIIPVFMRQYRQRWG